MGSTTTSGFIAFAACQGLVLYGVLALASHWGFLHLGQSREREIPDAWFVVLGLMLPVAGWFLSFFVPAAALVLPASLAVLFLRIAGHSGLGAHRESTGHDAELGGAERMLQADSRNAAAYWTKAEICERRGDYVEAYRNYRRAHELSDQMVTARQLADIKERLECLAQNGSGGEAGEFPLRLEHLLFVAGLALGLWSWVYAVEVCSLMLFLGWLHSRR